MPAGKPQARKLAQSSIEAGSSTLAIFQLRRKSAELSTQQRALQLSLLASNIARRLRAQGT